MRGLGFFAGSICVGLFIFNLSRIFERTYQQGHGLGSFDENIPVLSIQVTKGDDQIKIGDKQCLHFYVHWSELSTGADLLSAEIWFVVRFELA